MKTETLTTIAQQLVAKAVEIDSLMDGLHAALLGKIEELGKNAEPAIFKPQAAKILGCSVPTLERDMRKKNPPPHHKRGGRVTFYASQLRAYMDVYRIGTIPQNCRQT